TTPALLPRPSTSRLRFNLHRLNRAVIPLRSAALHTSNPPNKPLHVAVRRSSATDRPSKPPIRARLPSSATRLGRRPTNAQLQHRELEQRQDEPREQTIRERGQAARAARQE